MSSHVRSISGLRVLSQGRLMVVVGSLVAAFVLFFPARQLVQQRTDYDRLRSRLAALSAENKRLSDEVSRLSDPGELEAIARERLGLVKPGEDAYYFVQSPPAPGKPPAPAAPSKRSALSRAWSWFAHLFHGGD